MKWNIVEQQEYLSFSLRYLTLSETLSILKALHCVRNLIKMLSKDGDNQGPLLSNDRHGTHKFCGMFFSSNDIVIHKANLHHQ